MNIERVFISGDEYMEYYFCNHCKLLAVEPRIHDGGYEQSNNFCKAVFCFSCTLSLQDFKTNKKITYDHSGLPHALCPAGCSKHFNPPFFRTLGPIESAHYDKIIIECPGCHQEHNPKAFCLHRTTCVPLRRRQPWNANETIGNFTPANQFVANKRRLWMENYESKNQVLSGFASNNGEVLSGDEPSLRVYMSNGLEWKRKDVPFCEDKKQFLKRVKESFGLPDADGDILAMNHLALSSCDNAKEFVDGLPDNTPFMFIESKDCLGDVKKLLCWLLLEVKKVKDFDPVELVSAAASE